jgi:cell division protein ZapA (FtsZ GTPase activity inhibitor)
MSRESVKFVVAGVSYTLITDEKEVLKRAEGHLELKIREAEKSSKVVDSLKSLSAASLEITAEMLKSSDKLAQAENIVDSLNNRLDEIDLG